MKTPGLVIAIVACAAAPAHAWDGPGMWYAAADGTTPGRSVGGGGILGTGGQHDYGIKCSDCHVDRATTTIQLGLAFTPALVGGTFVRGQRYTITAQLTGAVLPCKPGPNGAGMKVANFAASFEDDSGAAAGTLAPDTSTCGNLPQPTDPGTTALDGDCKVIFARGKPDVRAWRFDWTAPTTGVVHVYWGAVDGNCDMMSMGDAVTAGSLTLASPPAPAPPAAAISASVAPPWRDGLVLAARVIVALLRG